MGRRPYCPSRMEVNYCTFGFGAIIRCDLRTFSLLRDSPCNNQHACVIWVHARKATHTQQNYLAGLAMKKFKGTITHLHTWRQDGGHNRFPLKISLVKTEYVQNGKCMQFVSSLKPSLRKQNCLFTVTLPTLKNLPTRQFFFHNQKKNYYSSDKLQFFIKSHSTVP